MERGGKTRAWVCVGLFVFGVALFGAAGLPVYAADDEALSRRIEALEAEIARLQADLAALRQTQASAGAGEQDTATDLKTLQNQVEALTRELQNLRPPERVAEPESVHGLSSGASRIYETKRGLAFGGYGSMVYNHFTASRDDNTPAGVPDRISLREAFVYAGYRFDDHWLFNSSFGIEDAVAGDGKPGDATVEFAYIDYRSHEAAGFRGGLLLVPLGFTNERHQPDDFPSVERPVVEQRIIPTTWRGAGVGTYGSHGPLVWRAYVMESLDAAGFEPLTGLAGGRQQGAQALAEDFGLTARVDWQPLSKEHVGTLTLGAGGFTGDTGQNQPGFPSGRLSLWEAHAEYRWKGFQARALVARSILGDAEAISLAIDPTGLTPIGEQMHGLYGEVGYDLLSTWPDTHQRLVLFCRFENLDTQARLAPGSVHTPLTEVTVKTCGAQYMPMPHAILSVDAMNFNDPADLSVDQLNAGFGWTF
jgi:uncharacterized small protein (DUF1192 family)